uniref:Putative secreted protein n=1 Tax=Amblyomma americanum TaxID=6943 RepID=A0A0C9S3N5_AMBAM
MILRLLISLLIIAAAIKFTGAEYTIRRTLPIYTQNGTCNFRGRVIKNKPLFPRKRCEMWVRNKDNGGVKVFGCPPVNIPGKLNIKLKKHNVWPACCKSDTISKWNTAA